jgi:hypothetical protein
MVIEDYPVVGMTEILSECVRWYAGTGRGLGTRLFMSLDDEHQTYVVIGVDHPAPKYDPPVQVVVMARIVGDQVVIEADNTDRPLVKKLEARGIPRAKIILAYDGESIPDAAYFEGVQV